MVAAGYIILGIIAGVISGLVGIGGGVIIVPALIFLFGMSQQTAQGTTIAMLVLPVGALAALIYYRQGYVDIPAAALIALGFVAGSIGGAKLAVTLPTAVLEKGFGVMIVLIGLRLIIGR
jgi:uncharacterized membrane protein YfcA